VESLGGSLLAGLLLGLSSGGYCFWSCASVMAPYLVSTERTPDDRRWSTLPAAARTLAWYNLGRLLAYLAAGIAVTGIVRLGGSLPPLVPIVAQLCTAAVLAYALLRPEPRHRCWHGRRRSAAAFSVGLTQGLAPCPPFVAAIGLAFEAGGKNLLAAPLLFLALFLGTSLYTLPLAFLEPLERRRWLSVAARAIGGGVCVYLVFGALLAIARL
jgi:sulfite exporter TauE/SafE